MIGPSPGRPPRLRTSAVRLALALLALPLLAHAAERPVSVEEASAVLGLLADAHHAEDSPTVVALHDPAQAAAAAGAIRQLFKDRNYLTLDWRILATAPRADGGRDVEVVQTLRSRRVDESSDRREKLRWIYGLARRGDAVKIVSSHAVPGVPLPPDVAWRVEAWSGRVVIEPSSARGEGEAAVHVVATLRNDSGRPARSLAFLLHPFAEGLEARAGETLLEQRRLEGAVDTWIGDLPQAVAHGATIDVSLRYRIEEIGLAESSSITQDGARLLPQSAWLPVFRLPRRDDPARATHDLVVETPPDLLGVLPGALASEEILAGGRHALRWRSQLPGADLCLLAGRFRHEGFESRPGLRLEVFSPVEGRSAGGGRPSLVESGLRTLAWLERLAPCPVESFTLVEGAAAKFVAGPQLVALPDLQAGWRRDQDKEEQPFFFLAHHLAHAWVVDGAAPTGPGSSYVSEGLCDHLASTYAGEVVDPRLPLLYRTSVLDGIGQMASADQALVAGGAVPSPDVMGSGKALVVFDGLRELLGEDAWRSVIASWLSGSRGRPVESLLDAARTAAPATAAADYLATFLLRPGTAELRVEDVRLRALTPEEMAQSGLDPDLWRTCEIDVVNVGQGPVPLRVEIDAGGRFERRDVVFAGSRTTISLPMPYMPRGVLLDPDHVVWQSGSDDDSWPKPPDRSDREVNKLRRGDVFRSGESRDPWRDRLPSK